MNTTILRKTITTVAMVTMLLCTVASVGSKLVAILPVPTGTTGPLPGAAVSAVAALTPLAEVSAEMKSFVLEQM